jgi:hypothetical protein
MLFLNNALAIALRKRFIELLPLSCRLSMALIIVPCDKVLQPSMSSKITATLVKITNAVGLCDNGQVIHQDSLFVR